jgi:4-alpha-glucanotransferase
MQAYTACKDQPVEECVWALIRTAMASVSDLAIIPMQDYLCLGNEARMNAPSTFGTNWKWRLTKGQLTEDTLGRMLAMARLYGRY